MVSTRSSSRRAAQVRAKPGEFAARRRGPGPQRAYRGRQESPRGAATRGEVERARSQMRVDRLEVERAPRTLAQILERPLERREVPDHGTASRARRGPRAARVGGGRAGRRGRRGRGRRAAAGGGPRGRAPGGAAGGGGRAGGRE